MSSAHFDANHLPRPSISELELLRPVPIEVNIFYVKCPHHTDSTLPRVIFLRTRTDRLRRDMPPPGGFGQVQYKRNLSLRGPSGAVILGGILALTIYGFHRVALGRAERQ